MNNGVFSERGGRKMLSQLVREGISMKWHSFCKHDRDVAEDPCSEGTEIINVKEIKRTQVQFFWLCHVYFQ